MIIPKVLEWRQLTKHAAHQDTQEETGGPHSGVQHHRERYERLVAFPVIVNAPDDEITSKATEKSDHSRTVPCIPEVY